MHNKCDVRAAIASVVQIGTHGNDAAHRCRYQFSFRKMVNERATNSDNRHAGDSPTADEQDKKETGKTKTSLASRALEVKHRGNRIPLNCRFRFDT